MQKIKKRIRTALEDTFSGIEKNCRDNCSIFFKLNYVPPVNENKSPHFFIPIYSNNTNLMAAQ